MLLAAASLVFGLMAMVNGYASSPHYGWLLRRWAAYEFLALICLIAAWVVATRRWRSMLVAIAILLALGAADPLRRIVQTNALSDA